MDSGTTSPDSMGFQFQTNSTSKWDNELKFAAAGTTRTSLIILTVFSLVVAFVVTFNILLRSWKTLKRTEPTWDAKSSWLRIVQGRDIYPFVLSLGVVVQGIAYAVAQSKGLESLMILGCTVTSQLMLPAFFIVPFIQLVFGLELTIRIMRPSLFPFRGRFNTLICLVTIGTLLLTVLSITFAVRPSEFCFASLFSYLHRYDAGCFGTLLTVILIVLVECGFICFKLHTGARMGVAERDEASRMVYFMVIAVISYTLQVTVFYNTAFHDPGAASNTTMELAAIATVVADMSGLLLGCLYLFLRSSKSPTGCSDDEIEASRGFRKWDDQDQEPQTPGSAMLQPLELPKLAHKSESKEDILVDDRIEDKVFGARKDFLKGGLKPLRLSSMRHSRDLPAAPKPVRTSSKESIKNLKRSMYSIFPKAAEPPKSPMLLPTTTYTDTTSKKATTMQNLSDDLLAPPGLRLPNRNLRSSGASMLSMATVQIGLRLSNIADMRPSKPEPKQNAESVHNLDCPNSTVRFFPRKTSPLAIAIVDVPGEGTSYEIQDNFGENLAEKELPPVPLSAGMATPPETTLSSAVYSPQGQNPGPFSQAPTMAHNRQGSRSMGESSRAHSRHGSRTGPESGRIHSRQGSRAGPETSRIHSRAGSRADLEARKGPWI